MFTPTSCGAPAPSDATSVSIQSAPVLWVKWIGDDWLFAYTYLDLTDAPIPLINGAAPQAELFLLAMAPVPLTVGNGVTILDPNAATVMFKVPRALTATFQPNGQRIDFPTRIQIQLLDANGNLQTFRVDPIDVRAPQFADLCGAQPLTPNQSIGAQATPSIVLPGPAGASGQAGHAFLVTITQSGQTAIPLPVPPTNLSSVALVVNGVEYGAPLVTATSTTATWANPAFILEPSDAVELSYT